MQSDDRDSEHPPPEEVIDDRVGQHAHEQQQRAQDEPKHEGTPDRTVGTESSSQREEERHAAPSQDDAD